MPTFVFPEDTPTSKILLWLVLLWRRSVLECDSETILEYGGAAWPSEAWWRVGIELLVALAQNG